MSSINCLAHALREYGDLLFDLDNTLFATANYDDGAFSEIAMLYPEVPSLSDYLVDQKRLRGPLYSNLFDDAVSAFKLPESAITEMIYCYRHHDARLVQADPDYLSLLQDLRAEGHRLFLVSNGRTLIQHSKLQRLGFSNLFTAICICDGSAEWPLKPHPQAFINLDKKYKLNNPVMVGDTEEIDGKFAISCRIPYLHHCYKKE